MFNGGVFPILAKASVMPIDILAVGGGNAQMSQRIAEALFDRPQFSAAPELSGPVPISPIALPRQRGCRGPVRGW